MFKREKSLMLFGLGTENYCYRGLWLFLLVYAGATIFAAITTAPAYWAVEWLHSVRPSETTKWLLGKNIDIFFDRLRWAPIVVGLPWVLAKCGLFSLSNLGIKFSLKTLATTLKFFLFGLLVAGTIFGLQYVFSISSPSTEMGFDTVFSAMSTAILAGIILGFLEEIVFRGLIMRALYTASQPLVAVILSSLFFAYKHFKVPNEIWNQLPNGAHSSSWDIGWFVAYYDTTGIYYHFNLVEFASLTLFGMMLCAIYIRTKTLIAPVAVHAAIVFMIQTYRTNFNVCQNDASFWLGNAGMTNGIVPLCILAVFFCIFAFAKREKI